MGWLIEQLHETAGIPGTLGHHTLGNVCDGGHLCTVLLGVNDWTDCIITDLG